MPLRAFIQDKEVISSFLSNLEWDELFQSIKRNKLDVIIAETGKKGFLRTSKLGLQHFVHKKGEVPENWKPESMQHLIAKNKILLGCKAAGWDAKSEFEEGNLIADVLAIKDSNRIAFEVQWSPQTIEVTNERQKNYKDTNVRGCWFFRKPPKGTVHWNGYIKPEKELPIFKIVENTHHEIYVDFYDEIFDLQEFVYLLLTAQLKICEHHTTKRFQEVEIMFWEKQCWKCGTNQHVYSVISDFVSICGRKFDIYSGLWDNSGLEFHPAILKRIEELKISPKGEFIKLGEIKKRYSKTVHESYMSFGCIKCDAIFGGFFMQDESLDERSNPNNNVFKEIIDFTQSLKEEGEHWCRKSNEGFCE